MRALLIASISGAETPKEPPEILAARATSSGKNPRSRPCELSQARMRKAPETPDAQGATLSSPDRAGMPKFRHETRDRALRPRADARHAHRHDGGVVNPSFARGLSPAWTSERGAADSGRDRRGGAMASQGVRRIGRRMRPL